MRFDTFEDFCIAKRIPSFETILQVSTLKEKQLLAIQAFAKLILLTEELNEGHVFDWSDPNEEKWEPWFSLKVCHDNPSGFRYFGASCRPSGFRTDTAVSSGLTYWNEKDADFAGTTWTPLFRDMMAISCFRKLKIAD
jgi:hypothetical protein